jgi:hypothetical protein
VTYRIAVLVPSRGRPHNIARLHSAIVDSAANPEDIDLWVRVDDDDPAGLHAYVDTEVPAHRWIEGPRTRLAASWNELAELARLSDREYTHFALWGDDVVPETQGWDGALVGLTEQYGPGFAYGLDGVWDRSYDTDVRGHLLMPSAVLMSVEVYDAMGYVAMPGLKHLCIDIGWRDLGIATDSLFYAPDVMIRHLHRCVGAPDDQTYRDACDDTEQKRGDGLAYGRWRGSAEFLACVQRIGTMRAAVAEARKA